MKHAISELQALLDTWGGQKDNEWRLSLTQATLSLMDLDSGEWELREVSEQHRADMAETSREENANGGPDEVDLRQEFLSSQGRSLSSSWSSEDERNFKEWCSSPVPANSKQAVMTDYEIRMEHKDIGVPAVDLVGFAQEIDEVPLQYQRCKHGTAFRYSCEECDDDLGELDPSAACDLSKEGGCESCQ